MRGPELQYNYTNSPVTLKLVFSRLIQRLNWLNWLSYLLYLRLIKLETGIEFSPNTFP